MIPSFIDRVSDTQRSPVTCPRIHIQTKAGAQLEIRSSDTLCRRFFPLTHGVLEGGTESVTHGAGDHAGKALGLRILG